ncbi:MazG-related protein [Vibrio astriarenae]|uniref:MazG-related protein n=1 Tax=Vibrio astriarenae TaxID=1481923 RepID=A0A7Z2T5S6_9VIBR|nr:MazG-related protein [Vibrio astriarenae]QIA64929.1 MazG-related protein [Vibrio astriarenae]
MNDKVRDALLWLKDILEKNQIEYQIVGGFAAFLHGGSREIADIDLYINKSDAEKLLPNVVDFISKPLTHYVEGGWDLEYLQLIYRTQKIEIGLTPGTRIQSTDGVWFELETDFNTSVARTYKGIEVSVIPVDKLLEYKRILGREVDLIDIVELEHLK